MMLKALCAAAFAAVVSAGCTGLEPYSVTPPDDLAQKIAEYEAEKAAKQTDDYTEITITTALVGAEDNSSAWWSEFSQYFTVPSGKKLVLEFENYGSGVNNWNNWNVCLANGERDGDGYSEYFVLRSDWYGWGNADYNPSVIEFNYGGGEVNWDEFREKMQGSYVTMSVDHARAGAAYLEVHSVATDGFDIVEKYNQKVSATDDVNVFLIADGSHFNIKKAYLVPSEIAEIPDYDAVAIEVTGHPVTIPLGEEDYWGNAVATVTYEDGFIAPVAREDLIILEPDLTTTGTKTVVYTYNKTKQGKVGNAVSGYYNFEVTDLASITVTKAPFTSNYYLYDQPMPFYYAGMEITGYKSDGSSVVLDPSALVFSQVQPVAGEQNIEIDFSGVKTTYPVMVKLGTEAVGAPDYSNGWWTTFLSADKPVPAGESSTVHMFLYSDNLENWHSPCTILRGAALNEYAVVRMDNFGWGDGYGTATLECDWNFDYFAANQNMSAVSITVTNNGNNTADIVYNVTYANGESHIQKYSGITVDSADLQMGIVTEESYLIILDKAAVDAQLTSISAASTANIIGGARFVTLSPEAIKVIAHYSDGSTLPLNPADCSISFTEDKMVYEGIAGNYPNVATVKYTPAGSGELTANATLTIKASAQEGQTTQVGNNDFSNGWWSTFSRDWTVAPGESETVSMYVGSDNLGNWHSPCTILRKADFSEYGVVRMDHYGWGASVGDACANITATSNWNWDTFMGNINGSKVSITVANNGNGRASIRYHVIYENGEEHFQFYDNIAVDSEDVQFAIVTEESYLIFD
jgi:hypothetical protein